MSDRDPAKRSSPQPSPTASDLMRLNRQWARSGGQRFAKTMRRRFCRAHPGTAFPDKTEVAVRPHQAWLVFPPRQTVRRATASSFGVIDEARSTRKALADFLRVGTGAEVTWGRPTGVAGARAEDRAPKGVASLQRVRSRVTAVRLEAIGAIIAYDLTAAEKEGLERAGGTVIANQIVTLPKPIAEAVSKPDDGVRPVDARKKRSRARSAGATLDRTWHLETIGVLDRSGTRRPRDGMDPSKVLIGVIDTGVDASHREFAGMDIAFMAYGVESKQTGTRRDYHWHGTHVAALAAGRTVGVAPGFPLAVAAVLTRKGEDGEPEGELSHIVEALNWLVGLADADDRALVVNCSLGTEGFDDHMFRSIQDLNRAGSLILPVAAVGNDGHERNLGGSPADYSTVLAVGATDRNDKVAYFSSIVGVEGQPGSEKPELYAPGVQVVSAVPGGRYRAADGTSMAAPLVAGLAALELASTSSPGTVLSPVAMAQRLTLRTKGAVYEKRTGPIRHVATCP